MTTVDEQALRQYSGALERATGRRAGETQLRAALVAGAGGRAVVAAPDDILLVAALAATVATVESDGRVHLATANAREVGRLDAAFRTLGLDRITCAPFETFVFDYLKGEGTGRAFAVVADAEKVLLRDGHTPVVISKPVGPGMSQVTPDVRAEPDRLLQRERDYIVQDREIIIRDTETGGLFPGRRFSGGLHAAIQAREGLPVHADGEVVAQVTVGDYFRLYPQLAAVAVTADSRYQTEYGLEEAKVS